MCPIETTFSLINGKWKHRIIKELSQGPVRYGQLAREIPSISAKVLTQQLKELEADGMVPSDGVRRGPAAGRILPDGDGAEYLHRFQGTAPLGPGGGPRKTLRMLSMQQMPPGSSRPRLIRCGRASALRRIVYNVLV